MMIWAAAIALTLVTLWIMLQGYRIVTGQSREPMMHLVAGMSRIPGTYPALATLARMTSSLFSL